MNKWFSVLTCLVFLSAAGCSGKGTPVTPAGNFVDPAGEFTMTTQSDMSASSRIIWGYYDVEIDGETGDIEVVPLRTTAFNANVTQFLSPPFSPISCLTIQLLPDSDFPTGYLSLDITLKHPFQGINTYRGFDVRGIFMADGATAGSHDPDIVYSLAVNGEAELLNEDGYTRWWNSTEFNDNMPLLSYKPGALGSLSYPSATLNPYKYFADDLAYDGLVADLPIENRGVFSPDVSNHKRHYQLQFPVDGGLQLKFNYAVDASWELPDPDYAPDYPLEAFPPAAQVQEAYNIEIDTSESTAWFQDSETGGELIIKAEIFDWQAAGSDEGVPGQIQGIWLESPLLPAPLDLTAIAAVSDGSTATSAVYEVEIPAPDLDITSIGTFPLLITVESAAPDSYQPQIDGGEMIIFPDGPLAAYAMSEIEIIPGVPPVFTVLLPNGGELWDVGSSREITWEGGIGIPLVDIEYSKDNFVSDVIIIASGIDNDGSFTWDPIPDDPSTTVKVRVSDTADPLVYDDSDDYFTIVGLDLEMLAPNGGESWIIDYVHDIEWTGGSGIADVTLTYSKDDFVSDLNVIAAGISNLGTYEWNPVPNDPSDTVKIRVENASDPLVYDDSDDYFTITDSCDFANAPTFDSYDEIGAVCATGFHFMQIDSTRMVACRQEDGSGFEEFYPWLAVYDESDLTAPLDMFEIPGHGYPDRPFDFDVDSTDRIFFFMDYDDYGAGGQQFTDMYYIDWNGGSIDTGSFSSIDLTPYLNGGEMCVELFVDSHDDVYVLTEIGRIIKLDHTDSYSGTELFNLQNSVGYSQSLELDFLLAEDADVFFVYTDFGSGKRAIYKISTSGEVLNSQTDIFAGLVNCGSYTGGIGYDGDCRLIVIDGVAMGGWICMRYNYDLTISEYFKTGDYDILNNPGNTLHFNDDGTILSNAYFWQWKNYLVTWDPPADW